MADIKALEAHYGMDRAEVEARVSAAFGERVRSSKAQAYAEAYGAGDVLIGRTITGRYPNAPVFRNL